MYDARVVRGLERTRRLDGESHGLSPREALLRVHIERLPREELHDEEDASVDRLAEVVELHEVRVRELGDGACLLAEAIDGVVSRGMGGREHLHGVPPAELDVLGLEDLTARPFADLAKHAVRRACEDRRILRHVRGLDLHDAAGRRGLRLLAQLTCLLEELGELGARACGLVRPERLHEDTDARPHAAFAALACGGLREDTREVGRRM